MMGRVFWYEMGLDQLMGSRGHIGSGFEPGIEHRVDGVIVLSVVRNGYAVIPSCLDVGEILVYSNLLSLDIVESSYKLGGLTYLGRVR